MKKILFALTFAAALFTTAAYASEPYVSSAVAKSFEQAYPDAANVKWSTYQEFTIATFTVDNKIQYAYFNSDGVLKVTADVLSVNELSPSLAKELATTYSDFSVLGIYRMYEDGDLTYFTELKKGEKKVILNSSGRRWRLVTSTKNIH